MNKLIFASILGACAAHASVAQEEVFIPGLDRELMKIVHQRAELSLDHVSGAGFELYGPRGTKAWLDQIGARWLEPTGHAHGHKSHQAQDYPTFEEVSANLKSLAAKYPKIMSLKSIGRSVEGKELWVVKISDNVSEDEVEPEFKYISSMHGDEIAGRELTQFWIKDLLEGYGKKSEVTAMVDNTEIFVMPSMNPDGSKRRQRGNSNWVDLNRNFPDWTRGDGNTQADRQPETKAVMKFQAERQFALSANFHGGAVVVNYPWDATYDRHPFNELVKDLSLAYASLNPEMKNSIEFEDGVTNGADWYVLRGGMQDWSYFWHNDLQVTIELSQRKWPSYSNIPEFYKDNKDSMDAFAKLIHQGAGFKLKNSEADGAVKIYRLGASAGEDLGSYGFSGGEFYKVLEPGRYRFEVKTRGRSESFETTVLKDAAPENGNYTFL